jgi:WD40 repeat protein
MRMMDLRTENVYTMPHEVWMNVFNRLDTSSLLRAEQVCNAWRVFGHDHSLWRVRLKTEYPEAWPTQDYRKSYLRLWEQEQRWRYQALLPQTLSGCKGGIVCLALHGGKIFCGTSLGTCQVWDKLTLNYMNQHAGYHGCVSSISINDEFLILGSMDGTTSVLDPRMRGGSEASFVIRNFRDDSNGVLCVHHVGYIMVSSGTSNSIHSYDLRMMRRLASSMSSDMRGGAMSSVRLTPDGYYVISGDEYGTLYMMTTDRLMLKQSWKAHEGSIMSLDLHGNNMLSGSYDGLMNLWHVDDMISSIEQHTELTVTSMKHAEKVYNVCFVPELPLALTSCQDGSFHLWELQEAQRIRAVQAHHESIDALACDFECLLTGSENSALNLWRFDAIY